MSPTRGRFSSISRTEAVRNPNYGGDMTKNTEIRPYQVEIPQAQLDDLTDRLSRTRWTTPLPGPEWDRGGPQPYLKEIAEYWRDQYDWRKAEAEINTHPQFMTTIDGIAVHFLHVRSPEPD